MLQENHLHFFFVQGSTMERERVYSTFFFLSFVGRYNNNNNSFSIRKKQSTNKLHLKTKKKCQTMINHHSDYKNVKLIVWENYNLVQTQIKRNKDIVLHEVLQC